jgi:hypothetical protein
MNNKTDDAPAKEEPKKNPVDEENPDLTKMTMAEQLAWNRKRMDKNAAEKEAKEKEGGGDEPKKPEAGGRVQ